MRPGRRHAGTSSRWNGPCLSRTRVHPLKSSSAGEDPVLSVITPAYNAERYLAVCIESVLGQTLGNLEMLIVDDGSTDGTSGVIADYALRDPRVRGFRGPNRGGSHARNVAMRYARGRYFALLDSDDLWEPPFAATMVRQLDHHPEFAVVSGNGFNLGGPLDGRPVRPWPASPGEVRFVDLLEHEDAVFIMSVFRREVVDAIGGFNEALWRSEDYEYWLRVTAAGLRIMTVPEPLARYRRRPDSVSADETAMFESILQVLAQARGFRANPKADELAVIDRRTEELAAGCLLVRAKRALLRRDFVEARSIFWELHRRGKGLPFAAVAVALRLLPGAVLAAYRARLRHLERQAAEERRRRADRAAQRPAVLASGVESAPSVVSRPSR